MKFNIAYKTGKQFITFSDNEIEKYKFYHYENCIFFK